MIAFQSSSNAFILRKKRRREEEGEPKSAFDQFMRNSKSPLLNQKSGANTNAPLAEGTKRKNVFKG